VTGNWPVTQCGRQAILQNVIWIAFLITNQDLRFTLALVSEYRPLCSLIRNWALTIPQRNSHDTFLLIDSNQRADRNRPDTLTEVTLMRVSFKGG
jgi:hypothetical protein